MDRPAQENSEIEITPQMIEAGVDAYRETDREFDTDEQIVRQVFQAMVDSARKPSCEAALDRQSSQISRWWQT